MNFPIKSTAEHNNGYLYSQKGRKGKKKIKKHYTPVICYINGIYK